MGTNYWNEGQDLVVTPVPKPQAGFHYRWLSTDVKRLSQHVMGSGGAPGYEIVQGKNVVETRKIATAHGLPIEMVDGLHNRIMDQGQCLGRIPMQEHMRRQRVRARRHADRKRGVDEELESLNRRGIKTFVREADDMADRKAFAQRGPGTGPVAVPELPADMPDTGRAPADVEKAITSED